MAQAGAKSPTEAVQIATHLLTSSRTDDAGVERALIALPFRDSTGQVLFYVVRREPCGFVVTSADDTLEPIIAYSATSTFQLSKDNPLVELLEQDLRYRLAQVRAGGSRPATANRNRSKWALLTAGSRTSKQPQGKGVPELEDIRVAPFIRTRWGQGAVGSGTNAVAAYNYYTPPYGPGTVSNYVSGCGSTAWAQLLNYHRHPTEGVGGKTFTVYVEGVAQSRQLRGGDGLGGRYQWESMPETLTPASPEPQRQAVGALIADIGTAAGTQYSPGSSQSNPGAPMLKGVFGFENAIELAGISQDFMVQGLMHHLLPNLDAKLPVGLFVGSHIFLADGYGFHLGALYYHFNLGWEGAADAWYSLPEVEAGGFVFTGIKYVWYNIYPSGKGEILSGRVVSTNHTPMANVDVVALCADGGSYHATTDANGIWAMTRVPSGYQYTITASMPGYVPASADRASGTSVNLQGNKGNVWGIDFMLVAPKSGPVIIKPPTNTVGGLQWPASIAVVATGDPPPSYAWQRKPAGASSWLPLFDDGVYTNSATACLTINSVTADMDGDLYQCVLSNPTATITSAPPAKLTILQTKPVWTLQPTNHTILPGRDAMFAVAAKGFPFPLFQWQYQPRGAELWHDLNDDYGGSASPVLRVSAAGPELNEVIFRCIALNPMGAVTSSLAVLITVPYAVSTLPGPPTNFFVEGFAVDKAGDFYLAGGPCGISKLSADGRFTAFGDCTTGTNDGPIAIARFNNPRGVAVDENGTVYVADTGSHTIRRISPDGFVSTFAGLAGVSGVVDGTGAEARFDSPRYLGLNGSGSLYVADRTFREVSGVGAVSTIGMFGDPFAVDENGVLWSESGDALIGVTRETIERTLLLWPRGEVAWRGFTQSIGLDGSGNYFVADAANKLLRKIIPPGIVVTMAGQRPSTNTPSNGDGIGGSASFVQPREIAVTRDGTIYVLDGSNVLRQCKPVSSPLILTQPASETFAIGREMRLWVAATGTPPPAYQWFKDGAPVEGATNDILVLTNAQPEHGGHYTVVVSNVVSELMSAIAKVRVVAVTLSVQRSAERLEFYLQGKPDTLHILEKSYDWQRWVDAGTMHTDASGAATLELQEDTDPPSAFYRAKR